MSIRMLAQELYRLQKEVETLEKKIQATPDEEQAQLRDQLRVFKAEKDQLRRMLDGKIDRPSARTKKRSF